MNKPNVVSVLHMSREDTTSVSHSSAGRRVMPDNPWWSSVLPPNSTASAKLQGKKKRVIIKIIHKLAILQPVCQNIVHEELIDTGINSKRRERSDALDLSPVP